MFIDEAKVTAVVPHGDSYAVTYARLEKQGKETDVVYVIVEGTIQASSVVEIDQAWLNQLELVSVDEKEIFASTDQDKTERYYHCGLNEVTLN